MPPEVLKLLNDIAAACQAVRRYAPNLSPEQFENDVLLRSLVERQCEIVGEALRRLERIAPQVFSQIRQARRIVDFRNVIAHGYDSLDSTIVSQVVRLHIPELLADVQTQLRG